MSGEQKVWLPVLAALFVSVIGMVVVYGLESYLGLTESYDLEAFFKLS